MSFSLDRKKQREDMGINIIWNLYVLYFEDKQLIENVMYLILKHRGVTNLYKNRDPVCDMDENVGKTDKLIRIALGAVSGIASLAVFAGVLELSEVSAALLGVVSLIAFSTALTGLCGLYSMLGVDTCSESKRESL